MGMDGGRAAGNRDAHGFVDLRRTSQLALSSFVEPVIRKRMNTGSADRHAELHRAHRWNVPRDFNVGEACCRRWATDRARFALYWEDESGERNAWTFFDLQQQANRLSNALVAMGAARGDRIALMLPQRPETAIAHIAINQIGAVAVPLSFLFGPEALEYRLQHSGATIAIADPQSLPNLP